jgi:aryl-alcohol dehydrogenase-like predicted oxidoreductase
MTNVDQVRLGACGLHVSRVCLGMMSYGNDSDRPWVLDEAAAEPIIRRAVEGGITFFDTADVYSRGASEVATGRLVGKLLSRDEAVIATKVHGQMTPGPNGRGLSRKHVLAAIDASLQRLGMDYVDLYQIHRWDPHTPIEETMEALHDVVRAGKARYIGASSMFAWQFARAQRVAERHGWTRFVSMQNHYNLLYREEEREMIPQCVHQGVGIIPWSPLARGFLTGTRTREGERRTTRAETDGFQDVLYGRPEDFDVIDRLGEVAAQRGVAPAQMALAWLLHKPGVTAPIVGATKLEHLEDALAAAELALSAEEIARLEEAYLPHPVLGHD